MMAYLLKMARQMAAEGYGREDIYCEMKLILANHWNCKETDLPVMSFAMSVVSNLD